MRVIAGNFKGKKIGFNGNKGVRPTTGRAKEALFNILQNRIDLNEANCLDLFCGSGAIALELLSRGAAKITCVEKNKEVFKGLSQAFININEINLVCADASVFLENDSEQYEFIFLDPPYFLPNKHKFIETIENRNLLITGGLLVLEHAKVEQYAQLNGFIEKRVYGNSAFSFFQFHP